jgi:hypothetical protein
MTVPGMAMLVVPYKFCDWFKGVKYTLPTTIPTEADLKINIVPNFRLNSYEFYVRI